jgi:signal transduction histidine kinase
MGVQAGAAERILERDPDRARQTLRSIQSTAREAVDELRRLLSVLRADEAGVNLAPQPGLASLEPLVAGAREAGLPVELRLEGERSDVSPGLELSAYRVVQEALTNVRKHAPGAPTHVVVRYLADSVELLIDNDASAGDNGSSSSASTSDGHGLVGMQERVALYNGALDAGPRTDGGFTVRALLPHGTAP